MTASLVELKVVAAANSSSQAVDAQGMTESQ
jgi:hypothetical protein